MTTCRRVADYRKFVLGIGEDDADDERDEYIDTENFVWDDERDEYIDTENFVWDEEKEEDDEDDDDDDGPPPGFDRPPCQRLGVDSGTREVPAEMESASIMKKINRIANKIEVPYRCGFAWDIENLYHRNVIIPDFGPYTLDITACGQFIALGGCKGYLSVSHAEDLSNETEFEVNEMVRDVAFLQSENVLAVAQNKYPYIYNRDGTKIHCFKEHGEHSEVLKLQFLKKHLLLASINLGNLYYQDVTSCKMIASYQTDQDNTGVMRVNPYNNIVTVGHTDGTVSMWSPASSGPLVKKGTHKGPVFGLSFHPNGYLMATSGEEDEGIKLWDLRKLDDAIQTLPGCARTLDFSQEGFLASSGKRSVQLFDEYCVTHKYIEFDNRSMNKGQYIRKILFKPYGDTLLIGHSEGWKTLPTSGAEYQFDTEYQWSNNEVRSPSDKLSPETIKLDLPTFGTLKPTRKREKMSQDEEREAQKEAAVEAAPKSITMKKKKVEGSKLSSIENVETENL